MVFRKFASALIRGGYRMDFIASDIGTPGWYRTYVIENHRAYGYYGEFCICTIYNNSTNVVIKFAVLITHSKVEIHLLDSCGPTDVIDEIRVMRTSDESKYMIDIHYKLSNSNSVVFKCLSEVRGNTTSENTFYNAGIYAPVADSPSGEIQIVSSVDEVSS